MGLVLTEGYHSGEEVYVRQIRSWATNLKCYLKCLVTDWTPQVLVPLQEPVQTKCPLLDGSP